MLHAQKEIIERQKIQTRLGAWPLKKFSTLFYTVIATRKLLIWGWPELLSGLLFRSFLAISSADSFNFVTSNFVLFPLSFFLLLNSLYIYLPACPSVRTYKHCFFFSDGWPLLACWEPVYLSVCLPVCLFVTANQGKQCLRIHKCV